MLVLNYGALISMFDIMNVLDKIKVAAIITNRENHIMDMNNTAQDYTGWIAEYH